jgi:hypothetical protein
LQNSSHTSPPIVVVGFIVVIVAPVSGMVVELPLVVPSLVDSIPPEDAPLSLLLLLLSLPSDVVFSVSLALDDIELAAVPDPLSGSSSRLFTEQATPITPIITPSIRMQRSSPIDDDAAREIPQLPRGNLRPRSRTGPARARNFRPHAAPPYHRGRALGRCTDRARFRAGV